MTRETAKTAPEGREGGNYHHTSQPCNYDAFVTRKLERTFRARRAKGHGRPLASCLLLLQPAAAYVYRIRSAMATKATFEADAVSKSRSGRVEGLHRTRVSSGTGTKEYRAIKRHFTTIISNLGSTVSDPARFAMKLKDESLVTDGKLLGEFRPGFWHVAACMCDLQGAGSVTVFFICPGDQIPTGKLPDKLV